MYPVQYTRVQLQVGVRSRDEVIDQWAALQLHPIGHYSHVPMDDKLNSTVPQPAAAVSVDWCIHLDGD